MGQTVPTVEQPTYDKYVIDPKSAVEFNRALPLIVSSRRCYMDQQSDDDLISDTDRFKGYVKRIAAHCSKEQDYLLPDTPLKESIFRVILSEGNRPISAEGISGILTSKWTMTPFPRNTSPDVIQRLLDNCISYCIVRITAT